MVVVFLADGFEEIEALATVDILRRSGVSVTTVGVGGKRITGAHNIVVEADCADTEWVEPELQAVVLPGGIPGTPNLEASPVVQRCVDRVAASGGLVCAICAAPSILGHKGLLSGKRATCYPGFEGELTGAVYTGAYVEQDGNVITARGAGVSAEFALRIVAALTTPERAAQLKEAMQCR